MVEIAKKVPFHRKHVGNDLCVVPVENGTEVTYSTDRVDSLAIFGIIQLLTYRHALSYAC